MEKNNKKDNSLIKRKNLILEMKKVGISRISPKAILLLEEYITKNLAKLASILKEEMTIKGRKTLKKEDIQEALNKTKEKFWEI